MEGPCSNDGPAPALEEPDTGMSVDLSASSFNVLTIDEDNGLGYTRKGIGQFYRQQMHEF